jgi:hypothetical protein
LIFDAGALIALERRNRRVWARFEDALHTERHMVTHGGIIGQVWRDGRQSLLARALMALKVAPLDGSVGRRAGELLKRSRTSDVLDAAIVVISKNGDEVLTSDPHDIALLAEVARRDITIVSV